MSRRIEDLDYLLANAFSKAVPAFKAKHPTLPQPFLTCTNRTNEEQDKTFFKGRDANGKVTNRRLVVTNARAGQSPHNFLPSMAFDICFKDAAGKLCWDHHLFEKFRDVIVEIEPEVVWGYDWNGNKLKDKNDFDAPHYERKNWRFYIKKTNTQ